MEKYPEEIDNVLLHEMIHAYLNTIGFPKEHHGARFKKWMRKLNSYGFNVTVYNENSFTTKKYKYAIQCKGCGVIDKGVRKLKYDLNAYQCVVCGSGFDFIYKGLFYKAYKCDNCDEIFFEDDENAVEEQALCPYCDFELKEI